MKYPSDVVFTPAVKRIQEEQHSRKMYERMEQSRGWMTGVTSELVDFLGNSDSFYFGTSNGKGQPYIQHRGGNKGFLRPLDEKTLVFADYRGNKQFISIGNLSENPQATIFLMDYARQTRIKIWGTARVSEDVKLLASLEDPDYHAKIERAIIFRVTAWDVNCRQHIKQRFTADEIKSLTQPLHDRIKILEDQLDQLQNKPL